MFFGSVIPFATYSVPALASLCVMYMMIEFGGGTAAVVYAAISLLSVLLAADKETALMFTCFFGYYPIIKCVFERKLSRPIAWLLKFLVFNVSICATYFVITKIIIVPAVLEEFKTYTVWFVALLLLLGNILLVVFDLALTKLISAYLFKYRSRFIESTH